MKRLMFAVGEPPGRAAIERHVEHALRVFFAAYGYRGPSDRRRRRPA